MRVLHAAALLSPPSGILNQMRWEQQAADEIGISWQVKMFCPVGLVDSEGIIQESTLVGSADLKNRLGKVFAWLKLRWEYHRWLKSQEDSVDVFVLRYYVHDPFQLIFLRSCKKPVYLVHHTLEGPELGMGGSLPARSRSLLDNVMAGLAIRSAFGIIGVTNEIIEYEKERAGQSDKRSFLYPNGILFNDRYRTKDERGDVPEILFVASHFASWHGLDLLLVGLKRNNAKCVLHVVGDVFDDDLRSARNDPRVVVHGKLSQSEIQRLAERCWGGLSCFALHRVSMEEACTLKVREYLMLGLPVYAGYREVLPYDFPFFKCGSIDITEILNFFREFRSLPRAEISGKSKGYIDKKRLLAVLYDDLRAAHGER